MSRPRADASITLQQRDFLQIIRERFAGRFWSIKEDYERMTQLMRWKSRSSVLPTLRALRDKGAITSSYVEKGRGKRVLEWRVRDTIDGPGVNICAQCRATHKSTAAYCDKCEKQEKTTPLALVSDDSDIAGLQ